MGDKNFTNNSGSYLIFQMIIFLWFFGKQLLLKVCYRFARYSIFRRLGMKLGTYDPKGLKEGTIRLFLESYFDIAIGCFINLMAWYQCESLEEFALFFSTLHDLLNSMLVIGLTIAIIWFPVWIYKNVHENRDDLEHPDFQAEFGWLFEDMRKKREPEALYQFYFLVRRLFLAIILTFFSDYKVMQVTSFVATSVFQLIYLVRYQPFKKLVNFFIELFNEFCIVISSILVLTILNPDLSSEARLDLGWNLIYTVSANVSTNLLIVAHQTSGDTLQSLKERYEMFDNWHNKYQIENDQMIPPEQRQKEATKFMEDDFCEDWYKQRRWL